MRIAMAFIMVPALVACGDRSESEGSITPSLDAGVSAVPAIVSHLGETGRLPARSWLIMDRLLVGDHGPVLDSPDSYEARPADSVDSIMESLRRLDVRACHVRRGDVCEEAVRESAATMISIGPAPTSEALGCASPWWVAIASLDRGSDVPEEGYSSTLHLACLGKNARGVWRVTGLELRGVEN